MENYDALFRPALVFLDVDLADQKALFTFVSERLLRQGYVTEGFLPALVEREERYPTGLPTSPFAVAIPHTDPQHLIRPFIAVVRPGKPIPFLEMGSDGRALEASLVFVLGWQKSSTQAQLLQQLIDMFMKESAMKQLIATPDEGAFIEIVKAHM